jgi:hypothetical protein
MLTKHRLLILGAAALVAMTTPSAAHAERPCGHEEEATLLVAGLAGGFGSTVGPDGALYVTEPGAARISRVDPKTGQITTVADGLPGQVVPGAGGALDLAFVHGRAYVLVTFVGVDVGGTATVGIYRMDGPHHFTVVADIGTFNANHPPDTDFDARQGVQTSLQKYRGGFVVTDGHLNRVLRVTLDGHIRVLRAFDNIVPTGLEVIGRRIYMSEAGPVPHLPQDGKIVSFEPKSSTATEVASGGRLLVDVERGPRHSLYALAQGIWELGGTPGAPAMPNTGELLRVGHDGTFSHLVAGLNQPTSLEIIGNTAYVVTLNGEIWKMHVDGHKHHRHHHHSG